MTRNAAIQERAVTDLGPEKERLAVRNRASDLPEGWTEVSLAQICDQICDGTHFTPKYVKSGVPFYSVENITSGDFENTKFISREEHQALIKRCKPQIGDILMTRITAGILGDTKLIDWEVDASIYVSLALLKLNKRYSPNYVYQYSKSQDFRDSVESRGLINATPKKINMGEIEKIRIPIPESRDEQNRIANVLSDVQAYVEKLEDLLAKKKSIQVGAMQELLTGNRRLQGFSDKWVKSPIGDVAEVIMGQSPSSANYNDRGEGMPLIQGNADVRDRKTIRRIYTTEITKQARAGDIILSVRAPVGEVARATFDLCLGRGVCALRAKDHFLYYALLYAESRWGALSSGSTFDSVNSAEVKAFKIDWPSDENERNAICTSLSDLDRELEILLSRLEKARQFKVAIMQSVLTGKVRLV